MNSKVQSVIKPAVLHTSAYSVAAVKSGLLKMDAMEFPVDFTPELKTKWLKRLAHVELNRYPHATNPHLEQLLRNNFQIDDEYGVLFGNGSDELIQLCILACSKPDTVVLTPAPTFVMYAVNAAFNDMRYVGVDVNQDFSLNMPEMLKAIENYQPALIFLAVPNNPTATVYSEAEIQEIIDAAPGLVVLDEAYLPFAEQSTKALLDKNENVLIIRTISKMGFAGFRFGYLFGRREWTNEINKVRPPYNVSVLTQTSVEFMLENYQTIVPEMQKIVEQREKLYQILKSWTECQIWPSQANFLVLKVPEAKLWFDKLLAQNVLVKNLDGMHPLVKNCLRLTISNAEDNALMLRALENCR